MRSTMAETKDTGKESPTFIITQSEVPLATTPSKSVRYRKWIIIAVSVIVAAAIILAAILVGMYMFTQAQKDIIQFSYNRNQNTKEDVVSDPNTNIVQYHASTPDQEMWVIDDFNKDIQVTKIQGDLGTSCYVAPLNRTIATDPSKVSAPSDPANMDKNTTTVYYTAAKTPIPDSSFLCKAAKDACSGISTYWVFPSCGNPVQRQKRRCHEVGGCFWFFCAKFWVC